MQDSSTFGPINFNLDLDFQDIVYFRARIVWIATMKIGQKSIDYLAIIGSFAVEKQGQIVLSSKPCRQTDSLA